jgi:hypothetical protein
MLVRRFNLEVQQDVAGCFALSGRDVYSPPAHPLCLRSGGARLSGGPKAIVPLLSFAPNGAR